MKNIFPRDTKQRIREIAIKNGWNTHILQIWRDIPDGIFLSRLPKHVELTHDCIKTNLNYQKPKFYSGLFDESDNGPFEVPPGCTKTYDKKYVPDAPKLYVIQEHNSACVFC